MAKIDNYRMLILGVLQENNAPDNHIDYVDELIGHIRNASFNEGWTNAKAEQELAEADIAEFGCNNCGDRE